MAIEFEFLNPDDKPALIALTTPEYEQAVRSALVELGYKVHAVATAEDFWVRFPQVQYQIVVIEECFACQLPEQNETLARIQWLPMAQRRHATFFLLGMAFQSMNTMQAYQQSMHVVINPTELGSLGPIFKKSIADNELFMNTYKDSQLRIAQGKI
jgi:hypothetical protein